jgi:uncharacterized membrane protein
VSRAGEPHEHDDTTSPGLGGAVARTRATAAGLWATRAGRAALVAVAAIALGTVLGLAILWPSGDDPAPVGGAGPAQRAEVVGVTKDGCRPELGPGCRLLTVELAGGQRSTALFAGDALAPLVEVGATIRVVRNVESGLAADVAPPFVFLDFDRRGTLLLLLGAFVLVVGVLARGRGLLALLGLAASLVLLATFVVPAILDGRPPVAVALVGALAVLLVTTTLAHGLTLVTLAAVLGAATTLLVTAVLARVAVEGAQLTGLVSEQALVLRAASGGTLEPQGLLLAGMVIGALGVLDDVTVSQASVVAALRRAAPGLGARGLYREGIAVGRDHLAATVNTLALAYAGAALPVLLVFSTIGTSLSDAVNREVVAQEVVALLVGSIGLAGAVPLTTLVAVTLVGRVPARLLGPEHAGHAH